MISSKNQKEQKNLFSQKKSKIEILLQQLY